MPLIVNGETIEDALIEQEFSAIKSHFENMASISCCERDGEFRGYARDNLIFKALLTQEARRAISEPSASEVNEAFEMLKKEQGGDQFYARMGLTPEQDDFIRQDLSLNLRVNKLSEEICHGIGAPSDGATREHYQKHIEKYKTEEEVRASHIFKSVRQVENREDVFRQLCGIRRELIDGADFIEMAQKHSDKPAEEIDLGFFKRGELMDEFEVIAFSMNTGEVSPVFATSHGLHLAKLTGRKPAEAKPIEEVRDEVKENWLAEQRDAKLQEFVEVLKAKAEIKHVEPEGESEGEAHLHN